MAELPEDLEGSIAQARGMARDKEPPASLEEMDALYLDEIRRVQPAGPRREPNVRELAARLRLCLERARTEEMENVV